MKTRYSIIILIVFFLSFVASSIYAQESTTLHFMKGMPQSDLQNPALHNDSSKVVIGLPGFSGAYVDFNSGFAINDLIHKGTGMLADSLVLDIEGFHASLKETNSIQQHFSLPVFYLGIRSRKSFISFSVSEKIQSQFSFDKALVTFLKEGNAPYMGEPFDLGNLNVNAAHYREFALGYSNELLKNKLTVGGKIKLLYGKMAMQTERMNLKVETAADGSSLNLSSDMKVNFSGPATAVYDSENYFSELNSDDFEAGTYLMQTGNSGMAFDLGAVLRLTPCLTITGSIIDIGKISFKKDNTVLTHVASYKWEGIDFSKSLDESKADYVDPADLADAEMEKLEKEFKPQKSAFSSGAFDFNLPTKIYLGGTFAVSNTFSLGVVDRIYSNQGVGKNTLTFSANALLGRFFSVTGSYSMIGNSTNNIGAGMALRLGFMQMFVVSDNLMALNDPAKAEFVSARFGINFLFGRKHRI